MNDNFLLSCRILVGVLFGACMIVIIMQNKAFVEKCETIYKGTAVADIRESERKCVKIDHVIDMNTSP